MNAEMELKKIEQENEKFLHKLPGRDIDDVLDVYQYVATYNIGRLELELVKKDLIQIGLDANERGETFLQAIGDKASFVKEMVENYKKKPLIARVAKFLCILTVEWGTIFWIISIGEQEFPITIRTLIIWGGIYLVCTVFRYKGELYLRVMKGDRDKQVDLKQFGILLMVIALGLSLGHKGHQVLFTLPVLPTLLAMLVFGAVTGGIWWYYRNK